MVAFNTNVSVLVLGNYISVQAAAAYSGYSEQYLRRLLRSDKLSSIKVGQLWFIEKPIFDDYIKQAENTTDRRFRHR